MCDQKHVNVESLYKQNLKERRKENQQTNMQKKITDNIE